MSIEDQFDQIENQLNRIANALERFVDFLDRYEVATNPPILAEDATNYASRPEKF
jgi:hypothetical protein